MDKNSKIAFLGLGTMGAPMARRVLAAGYPLTVWNRSPERAAVLAREGARVAETPAEAVREADVVLFGTSTRTGAVGTGAALKIVLINAVVAGVTAIGEAMALADALGLPEAAHAPSPGHTDFRHHTRVRTHVARLKLSANTTTRAPTPQPVRLHHNPCAYTTRGAAACRSGNPLKP